MNRIVKVVAFFVIGMITSCVMMSAQTSRSADWYRAQGYQVFPEYGIAIKAAVKLEDVSQQAKTTFALNLGGVLGSGAEMCAYQFMISKLPAGYKDYSEQEIQALACEMIKTQMSKMNNVKKIYFSDHGYVGYAGDTTFNGYKQKAVMFYRDGMVFALTAIGNYMIDSRFNAFTNSVKFF